MGRIRTAQSQLSTAGHEQAWSHDVQILSVTDRKPHPGEAVLIEAAVQVSLHLLVDKPPPETVLSREALLSPPPHLVVQRLEKAAEGCRARVPRPIQVSRLCGQDDAPCLLQRGGTPPACPHVLGQVEWHQITLAIDRPIPNDDAGSRRQCQQIRSIPPKRTEHKQVSYLEEHEMQGVLDAVDINSRTGIRDRALLLMLYNTGARVSEIVGLKLPDLRVDDSPQVRLLGKIRVFSSGSTTSPANRHYVQPLTEFDRKDHGNSGPSTPWLHINRSFT